MLEPRMRSEGGVSMIVWVEQSLDCRKNRQDLGVGPGLIQRLSM